MRLQIRKKRKVSSVMGWLLNFQLRLPGEGVCCAVSIGGEREEEGVGRVDSLVKLLEVDVHVAASRKSGTTGSWVGPSGTGVRLRWCAEFGSSPRQRELPR
jgi:hypothetical protein